jgi:hypothetical protein
MINRIRADETEPSLYMKRFSRALCSVKQACVMRQNFWICACAICVRKRSSHHLNPSATYYCFRTFASLCGYYKSLPPFFFVVEEQISTRRQAKCRGFLFPSEIDLNCLVSTNNRAVDTGIVSGRVFFVHVQIKASENITNLMRRHNDAQFVYKEIQLVSHSF